MRLLHPAAPRRRLHGIYLIELLAVLIVFGAVMLIAAQVASTSSLVTRDARRLDATATQLDAAISLLRKDVWSADVVETSPAGDSLSLVSPDGLTTLWNATPAGYLTRTSPGGTLRAWQNLPPITFSAAGPLVTLSVARHPSPRQDNALPAASTSPAPTPPPSAEQISFPSQLKLARGGL